MYEMSTESSTDRCRTKYSLKNVLASYARTVRCCLRCQHINLGVPCTYDIEFMLHVCPSFCVPHRNLWVPAQHGSLYLSCLCHPSPVIRVPQGILVSLSVPSSVLLPIEFLRTLTTQLSSHLPYEQRCFTISNQCVPITCR